MSDASQADNPDLEADIPEDRLADGEMLVGALSR